MKFPSPIFVGTYVTIVDGHDLLSYVESFYNTFKEMPIFEMINGEIQIKNECYKIKR